MVVNEESAEWRTDWEEAGNMVVILLFVVVVVVAASPTPVLPTSTPPPVLAELCPNLENPDLTDPASDPFDKLDRGEVALILPLCDWF